MNALATLSPRRFTRPTYPGLLPLLLLLLAGCQSVGPDYEAPVTSQLPTQWQDLRSGPADATAGPVWWKVLSDPLLDELIARAHANSPDWREAVARLREARALRGAIGAARLPVLEGGATYQRERDSRRTAKGGPGIETDLYAAGLDAAWEIDLWGRINRLIEAAEADLAASLAETEAVRLTLAAEVALNYVELRAFQNRLHIARRNVTLQEQTLELVQARFDGGLVSERDVAQAATNLAITRSRVPAFESNVRAAENRLTVLLGEAPGALAMQLRTPAAIPVAPVTIAIGVPADLVRRRPDIRQAERALAAEYARIGVASAERFPRLTLFGSLGVAADDLSDLGRGGSQTFSFGPSIRWTLFDGGRLRRRVDAQDARAEQALVRWERTVLQALEETETSLTAFLQEQQRRAVLLDAATQARRAVELAQFQYTEGQTDFQSVLDSQRALAVVEDDLAQSEAAITTQAVVLFKALGG
jgi:NodT family efflux transporter outer membrane factor (OMF) lipoprotein